ncbi:unnamed protein product [Ectocarpus sp. 8 AP-2014]
MPNLEVLRLLDYHDADAGGSSLLRGIEWPKGIRHLTLLEGSVIDGVVVPETVQIVLARHAAIW